MNTIQKYEFDKLAFCLLIVIAVIAVMALFGGKQ